jgi:hypothetical protein
MKLSGYRQIFSAATILAAACCVSCNRPAVRNTIVKPGPEESFNLIYDVFRRRMEDTQIGFVMTDASGRSVMSGNNKVSYELIRPASEGEPYKAIVTVTSESHYSIRRIIEDSNEDSRDKANSEQADETFQETDQDTLPFESGAPGNAADESSKQKSISRTGEKAYARRQDGKVRNYELIYEKGRWNLVTELDEKTEKAIENAFNNALNTQI